VEWRLDLGGRPLGLPAIFARRLGSRLLGSRTVWLAQSARALAVIWNFHRFLFVTNNGRPHTTNVE
jgi:hypothetical protein